MKRIYTFFLAAAILFSIAGCNGSETQIPDTEIAEIPSKEQVINTERDGELSREEMWIADINYLKEQYIEKHKDPFYYCSEEEFCWKIDRLVSNVASLSDNDIYFELAEIIAGMGDSHTRLVPPEYLYESAFPINVRFFGEKLYLYSYCEGYEQFEPYLLQEIVAVNGVDLAYLIRKAESVSSPTNSWLSKEDFWQLYMIPAFLDWAGCCNDGEYSFQILNENMEIESVSVPTISYEDFRASTSVRLEGALRTPKFENSVQYFDGENGGFICVSLSNIDSEDKSYQNTFEKANELMETYPDCKKLVFDLRPLPGGYGKFLSDFREDVSSLKANAEAISQTYVLTGGYTGSLAIECVSILKKELNAVTVGEPTRNFSTFFAYSAVAKPVVLPCSGITVNIADMWNKGTAIAEEQYDENGKLYIWENKILPDVFISQDVDDIRQGDDSIFLWVLRQPV